MKAAITLLLAAALGAGNALAQGGPPAGKPGMGPGMGMGMGMMDEKHMAQMQEHMKTMRAQMERIHKSTDPAERRKLMQEHMQSMHAGMGMMRGMGGPMMGGKGMGMMGGDPKHHQQMMERRMDMMHMMMEQMMQHQQHSAPAK
ncbi:MAG: hypothetical protein FJY56_18555 [Betaproteobacteria bacterium]|nr:hypothetical protein [Betaproteobacteria bacterium]